MHEVMNPDDMRMSQFEAPLRLALQLVKRRAILDHQIGQKFQRDLALQFFVARQPHNSHSAPAKYFDERVAAKDFLSAGELTRRRRCDIACAFVTHFDGLYITRVGG